MGDYKVTDAWQLEDLLVQLRQTRESMSVPLVSGVTARAAAEEVDSDEAKEASA